MMIQSSIITVLLVSTCFQSFTQVQAFDPEDAAGFVQPFNQVAGVLPAGGTDALLGGLVPDVKQAVGGSLGKRDEESDAETTPQDGSVRKTSGEGVATYSDANDGSGLSSLGKDLLAQLKKRYGAPDNQHDLQDAPGKTSVSLLSLRRRDDLGLNKLLGNDATMQDESGLVSNLGLRRRQLLGGGGGNDADATGGASVSLIGLGRRDPGILGGGSDSTDGSSVSLVDLRRRNADADKQSADQQTSSKGHTKVSLLDLRRRNLLPAGLLGGESDATDATGTSVSLLGKRGSAEPPNVGDMGEPLDRRSTSVLSGAERMDRARQGVVVDSRHAVYARDNDHDRRIIEDYEKLMKERQEEASEGQQTGEQEKKGPTKISLASLRRRLVDGVVQNLAENLDLAGTQGGNDLL